MDRTAQLIAFAVLAWGAWGVLQKLALRSLPPASVMVVTSAVSVLVAAVHYAVMRERGPGPQWDRAGVLWAVAAAVASQSASLAFVHGLAGADATRVVTATAAYPAVTFLLALLVLGEAFTWTRAVGVLCVVVGIALVSR